MLVISFLNWNYILDLYSIWFPYLIFNLHKQIYCALMRAQIINTKEVNECYNNACAGLTYNVG